MRTKRYYVYIMASRNRTIYVGMTGLLMTRALQHKASAENSPVAIKLIGWFITKCFNTKVETAIRRETEIKKWRREKKIALIEKKNPTWEDLAADWGKQVPMSYRPPPLASKTDSTVIPRS